MTTLDLISSSWDLDVYCAAVLMRESVAVLCGADEMQPGCDDSDIWNVTRGVVSSGAGFKAPRLH